MWRDRLATWNRWIPGWVVYFLAGWVLIRGAIVPSMKQVLVFTVITGIIGQLILWLDPSITRKDRWRVVIVQLVFSAALYGLPRLGLT
jgi:hypothetical protein